MPASAEFLWRLNREYVNRLARARTYLDLLEQLVQERAAYDAQEQLLPALQFTHSRFSLLSEEHRGWCYTDFYESPQTKRMVHSPRAVERALTSFERMRDQHRSDFADLAALLDDLPRPDPHVTHIPNGDLWEMVRLAVNELADFSAAMQA